MQESSTSSSSQDLYVEIRTCSGCNVEAVDRCGCPFDHSKNVSFVEFSSCEQVFNFFQEVRKSESGNEWLASMQEEFFFFSRKQGWATL